jgi:anti-anti-sigma factor
MAPRITTVPAGGVQVIGLHGEFDVSTTASLTAALEAAARGSQPFTVVDLEDTCFVDCATLQVLMSAARRHTARGGRLALASARGTVARVLDLSGAAHDCAVFATTSQAVTVLEQEHHLVPGA